VMIHNGVRLRLGRDWFSIWLRVLFLVVVRKQIVHVVLATFVRVKQQVGSGCRVRKDNGCSL
jgi:hypothetical protein